MKTSNVIYLMLLEEWRTNNGIMQFLALGAQDNIKHPKKQPKFLLSRSCETVAPATLENWHLM